MDILIRREAAADYPEVESMRRSLNPSTKVFFLAKMEYMEVDADLLLLR